MTVLLLAPTAREAAALARWEPLVCGAGEAASRLLENRLATARPTLVLLAGFCGGLDPSLAPGSVVLCRRVTAPGAEEIEAPRAQFEAVRKALRAQRRPFVSARLLTTPGPVATRAEKTDLWNEYGAAGVDMETYGVAAAASAAGVPWLAIRAVIDAAGTSLPRALRSWSPGTTDQRVAAAALRNPLDWPKYGRFALHARAAQRALRRTVPVVLRAAAHAALVEDIPLVPRG
ncbi:MAG: hypothetical protein IT304_07860 [Dehalococcoidia bacterium]|nr:hypothetical protein [Dehalococcoidia bacterium]